MLNYIRAELYRLFRRPGLYVTTLVLCAAPIAFNCFLAFFDWEAYGTDNGLTGISYGAWLSSTQYFMIMGAIIPGLLYTNARKYGDLKNTIAFGVSRVQIFAGKCIISILLATLALAVLLAVWIGSAELLLTHSDWPAIKDVLLSVPVLYLIACANAITIVLFMELIERDIFMALAWAAIWCILPTVLNTLGMRFDLLAEIANWMPYRFLQEITTTTTTTTVASGEALGGTWSVNVADPGISLPWYSAEGLRKCLVSGAVGTALFSVLGWITLRRRDL